MKITKSTLKQLIKEELLVMTEQQSPGDLERQQDITAAAAAADRPVKRSVMDVSGRERDEEIGLMNAQVDLLTDVKALLQQILRKP